MSNASDRNDRPEDLANFAPKWARDPTLRDKRDASRLAGDESRRSEPVDEAPPIAPSAGQRDADVADLRLAREAHYVSRRRGDEFPGRGGFASEERGASDPHRMARSLEPTMMHEPPRRATARGLLAFFAASALAAAVVAVVLLLIGGKVSFEWNKAGSSTSDANSLAPPSVAKAPQEPEQPAQLEQRASPAPQLAAADPRPTPEEPASTPVRKAIEAAPAIRGVSDNEIRFGMSAPFTGPARELGQQMKLGVETAFRKGNEAGGVHGRQLSLVAADDGYEPDRTAQTMKQLYDKHQVFGVVGNVGTPTAVVAVPYALEKRMLFYGAFTGAGLLRRDPPDRYVINYRASYAEETDAVVRYLVKVRRLRPEQIAVFAQQDAYGDAGFAGVVRAVRALGGSDANILRLDYKRNTVDVEDAIARLRAHKAPIKAIVMVAAYRAAAKFIEKTRDVYPAMIYTNVSFVGSTALADELMLLGPRYANGVIVTQVVPAIDGYSSLALAYKTALGNFFPGVAPDYVSMEGFVAANVLIEALKRTGPQLDTEKLVDTFEGMRGFDMGLGTLISYGRAEHQGSHKVWGTQLDGTGHYQAIELQ
jgi:ABC-type branched-subunit amino acid transport system substrate-binding protein